MGPGVFLLRRSPGLFLTALLLCACHDRDALLTASASAEARPTPTATGAGPPDFVGQWAPSPAACGQETWSFTAARMDSPSALSCAFDRVDSSDAGYTAIGVCTVGRAKAPGRLVFTMTGDGASRSLTMNGGPFPEPVALVRCPDKKTQVAQGE